MVLTIIFWFKFDYCFTIMTSDSLVYYVTFKRPLSPLALFVEYKYEKINMHCEKQIYSVLFIGFKIMTFFTTMLLIMLCDGRHFRKKHLHDRIIPLRDNTISLALLLFSTVSVPSQDNEHSFIYVSGLSPYMFLNLLSVC